MLGLQELTITVAVIGLLLLLVVVYAACCVSAEWSEDEDE